MSAIDVYEPGRYFFFKHNIFLSIKISKDILTFRDTETGKNKFCCHKVPIF